MTYIYFFTRVALNKAFVIFHRAKEKNVMHHQNFVHGLVIGMVMCELLKSSYEIRTFLKKHFGICFCITSKRMINKNENITNIVPA